MDLIRSIEKELLKKDIPEFRVGDTVRVSAYGQTMSLKEVGQVSAPEPRLLVVPPWDKSLV